MKEGGEPGTTKEGIHRINVSGLTNQWSGLSVRLAYVSELNNSGTKHMTSYSFMLTTDVTDTAELLSQAIT